MLVAKGTGGQRGRKFIYADPSSARTPRLVVTYTSSGSGGVSTSTPTPTSKISPTPTIKPTATPILTSTPTVKITPTPSSPPTSTTSTGGTTRVIYGAVGADTLGTCSAAVHDKYTTVGPDGKTYRTWHPAQDPSGCTFGHEHGDNPAAANNYTGKPVPFGYIASHLGMDEPHVGFKCFVHNKGTRNDEGTTALHDSYYCFHMGTGGPARFNARFHSQEFHVRASTGAVMHLQAMADIGNVGTICDNPRQQRTVQGFGCIIDSGYEIWANDTRISNKGTTVAFAETSTAVFDPITSMDPANKTRLVYSWSEEAQAKIFRFVNDRTGSRGCEREAYSGPLSWYNRGGSQVYFTDAYGNVVDGGPLKQEISTINNNGAGALDRFGALIMGYKGGNTNDPQLQFKFHKSACVPGLGVKN